MCRLRKSTKKWLRVIVRGSANHPLVINQLAALSTIDNAASACCYNSWKWRECRVGYRRRIEISTWKKKTSSIASQQAKTTAFCLQELKLWLTLRLGIYFSYLTDVLKAVPHSMHNEDTFSTVRLSSSYQGGVPAELLSLEAKSGIFPSCMHFLW